MFINAAEHFEKGKRQNFLRQLGRGNEVDDVEKIVSTYQNRNDEERYSRRVSIEEIEKNGFNLNISRYVSTAEPEEEIELADVHRKLVKAAQNAQKARDLHNEFLKELGLECLS